MPARPSSVAALPSLQLLSGLLILTLSACAAPVPGGRPRLVACKVGARTQYASATDEQAAHAETGQTIVRGYTGSVEGLATNLKGKNLVVKDLGGGPTGFIANVYVAPLQKPSKDLTEFIVTRTKGIWSIFGDPSKDPDRDATMNGVIVVPVIMSGNIFTAVPPSQPPTFGVPRFTLKQTNDLQKEWNGVIPSALTTKIYLEQPSPKTLGPNESPIVLSANNRLAITDTLTACSMLWAYDPDRKVILLVHVNPSDQFTMDGQQSQVFGPRLFNALLHHPDLRFEDLPKKRPNNFGAGPISKGGYDSHSSGDSSASHQGTFMVVWTDRDVEGGPRLATPKVFLTFQGREEVTSKGLVRDSVEVKMVSTMVEITRKPDASASSSRT